MVKWTPQHEVQWTEEQRFTRCPMRWWLAASVLLLNVSNYSHWISFASIKSRASDYYGVSNTDIQLVLSASYAVGVPTSLGAFVITDKFGLKLTLRLGGFLTCFGSLLCLVSSVSLSYSLLLMGQVLTGLGCPLIACLPTKVSQAWFPSEDRLLLTSVLGLSSPLGMILGQLLSPLLVFQMTLLQLVYCAPSIVGLLIALVKVVSDQPSTPPSRSEASRRTETISSLRRVTSSSFWVLVTSLGGLMAFVSIVQMLSESWLMPMGYSNVFCGLSSALVFIGGILGALLIGPIVQLRVERMKLMLLPLALMLTLICIFINAGGGRHVEIALVYFLFGLCAIGLYPSLLELAVETTFPMDEMLVTSAIFVSSAVQSVILVHLEDLIRHLLPHAPRQVQRRVYVASITMYALMLVIVAYLGFKVEMRRTRHDLQQEHQVQIIRMESIRPSI